MKSTNYFLGIMMAIVGLIMLLAAESILKILVIVLGISALINGVFVFTSILPLCEERTFKIECIARASISVLVGLVCIVIPLRMVEFVWQTFVYIFAVYAVVSAVLQIATTLKLSADGFPVKRHAVEIAATIVLAIVLFMLPSSFGFTIIRIGGILLILAGATIALVAYKNRDIIIEPDEVA